ncbi:MAG: hypothetical protein KatS3mg081_0859 [Gemmatimonadales bacterium]|nr:MAG: hypothetical protein KatS3mg081_0859 [Gemmatimonadales bacterium]
MTAQFGLYVADGNLVSDRDIQHVQYYLRDYGLVLDIHFSPEGAARLSEVTRQNVGKRLAIIIESELVTAPVISGPLKTDRIQLALPQADLPQGSADRIVRAIRGRWP